MSNITVSDASGNTQRVDTFTRSETSVTVNTQAIAVVNPTTGTSVVGLNPSSSSVSTVPATVTSTILNQSVSGSFAALSSNACRELRINNSRPDAVDLAIRRGTTAGVECIPNGTWAVYDGIVNSNELQIKRWDELGTAITVTVEIRV